MYPGHIICLVQIGPNQELARSFYAKHPAKNKISKSGIALRSIIPLTNWIQ